VKISLVTVCYNSEATIRDTFDSVLKQVYPDIEYIIVDGASKDGTVSIIKEYEAKFNCRMIWISEPDRGLYDAMNKGIKMASGKVVGIINADDFYCRDDTIKKVVAAFVENADIQSVFGDIRFVNSDNLNKTVRYYSSKKFNPRLFRFGFMPAHPTFFTYRQNFEKYGYYRADYKIAADYELLIRFLYKNKLTYKYLAFDFLKMRTGGNSTASLKSRIILNREIVRGCRENGIYTNMLILLFKYSLKIFELMFLR
jgi:glycosyltransferase involved in cell wall biosynthesis